jgi:hypothetical protein
MKAKLLKQIAAVVGSIVVIYYVSAHYDALKKAAAK